MTLHEFLEKTGLADRTLRKYHQERLVPQTGPDGRYGELHYLRAMAIPLLRRDGISGSPALKNALDEMSIEQLRQIVEGESDGETVTGEARATASVTPAAVPPTPPQTAQTRTSFGERHVHLKLRDGIVLDVRLPLDEEGQAIVRKVASMFGFDASFD